MEKFSVTKIYVCPKCGSDGRARGHKIFFYDKAGYGYLEDALMMRCERCDVLIGEFAPLDTKEAQDGQEIQQ